MTRSWSRVCACATAAALGALALCDTSRPLSASSGAAGQDTPPLSSWNRVVSGDIEAVGEVTTGELRRTVAEISSFRSTVGTVYSGWRVRSAVPTRLVVFPNRYAFPRSGSARSNYRYRGGLTYPSDACRGYERILMS